MAIGIKAALAMLAIFIFAWLFCRWIDAPLAWVLQFMQLIS